MAAGSDLAGFVLFKAVSLYVTKSMDAFVNGTYGDIMLVAQFVAWPLLTLWITWQGYAIMSGQSRESLMAFVLKAGRVMLIMMCATGFMAGHKYIQEGVGVMRDTLSNVVLHNSGYDKGLVLVDNDSLKTGKGGGQSVYTQTDILLFELQAVMSGIDEINAANDPTLESKKERASMAAMIGGGTPAMVGGTLVLLNQIALGIGIMFAPIFILCLLFQQTQNLFYHWLKYSVTLVFSMAVLTVMVSICVKVAIAYAGAILVLLSAGGSIMDAAMLQAGLGIVLTVLMVSVPPMVVNFFGTMMGGSSAGNNFSELIRGTVNRNTPVPANSAAAGSGSPTTGGGKSNTVDAADKTAKLEGQASLNLANR